MRYVIYGAGAIGGAVGARLAQSGRDVALIARGAHLGAIQEKGLLLRSPDGDERLQIPAVESPRELDLGPDDVVMLAMKTQDTEAALGELQAAAGGLDLPVLCAQNGVENERLALRRFRRVYGMTVMMPASHLEPGVVRADSSPVTGMFDIGRYPEGVDQVCEMVANDLNASTFNVVTEAKVMRWKYSKLLMNLGNAPQAICGPDTDLSGLVARARREALACYEAAGIDCASAEETRSRRGNLLNVKPVAGARRKGGSSWQSLERGTGSIEADYLNGEIALIGREHGVPTPVNATLQRLANQVARDRLAPGSMSLEEVQSQVRTAELPDE